MAQIIHIAKDGTDILGVLPGLSNKKTSHISHNGTNVQWSLKLPNGGVLAFLAGTREIADEYVYTCNYWAARVSKEPLVEAVSSVEYGWGRPLEVVFGPQAMEEHSSNSSTNGSVGGQERPVYKSRSKSMTLGISLNDDGATSTSSATSIASGEKEHLPRKKASSPNFGGFNHGKSMQSQLLGRTIGGGSNIHGTALTASNTRSTTSSGTSATNHTASSSDSSNSASNKSSAFEASAAATAAATSLLGITSESLTQLSLKAHTLPSSNLRTVVTTKRADNGTVVTHRGRKFYLASGSVDTLFINNTQLKIRGWRPAQVHSAVHSQLDEESQLAALVRHTATVEETLEVHTGLRGKMMTVFNSGLIVSKLVNTNWEKKSNYLLREAVKYDIYILTLNYAIKDRSMATGVNGLTASVDGSSSIEDNATVL